MNKSILAFVFSLFAFISTYCQNMLVMEDGSRIEFETITLKRNEGLDWFAIQTSNGKRKIKYDSAHAYVDAVKGKVYCRINLPGFGNEFVERVQEGTISVLEHTYFEQVGSQAYKGTAPFMEKGSVMELLDQNSSKMIPILQSMMGDCPSVAAKLTSQEDQFLSVNDRRELIREYNLYKYTKPVPGGPVSSVFFFSRIKRNDSEQLKLIVNEETETLVPAKGSATVQLQTQAFSKVCASYKGQTECEIIQGSPYAMKYYEITYKDGSKRINIELIPNSDAQRYIQFTMKNKK